MTRNRVDDEPIARVALRRATPCFGAMTRFSIDRFGRTDRL